MEASAQSTGQQAWCPVGTPGIVALAVMTATFMEVLDSTVVNVSLPHIAGSLSATIDESTWVLTSYLVSNAVVLPASGWLSMVFGRKRYYMASVVIFTVASLLCGLAPSLSWLVAFRVLQGLGGGGLQPLSQAILLEAFPAERRGQGMAIFGIGVVFAPIIGPTLGGWITDAYSWRWIFYINLPVGILSLILAEIYIVDPPYLRRTGLVNVDYIGLGLLALGIGALQVVLDTGQRNDWFASSSVTQLTIISVVALVGLIIWEWRAAHPIIDLSVFRVRNFWPGALLIFILGVALYGSLVLLPVFLQTLLGYTALQSGLAMSPGGIATLFLMPLVGYLVGRRDARYLVLFGLSMLSASMFLMSHYNLNISFWQAMYPRIVLGIGLAFLFVPLATVTFGFMPREKMGTATGIFNLMRNIGGSFGIAAVNTMLARRLQYHEIRLGEHISPYNPDFQQWIRHTTEYLVAAGQSQMIAQKQAMAIAVQSVIRQANTLAFIDTFWLMGVVIAMLMPTVFLMRRPPRQQGGAPAAH